MSVNPNWQDHPILQKHPHYEAMCTDTRWGRWRAIMDAFEQGEQKQSFLPKAQFEQGGNYDCRLSLSHFMGVSPEAIEQIVGAVFGQDTEVQSDEESVEEFAMNADGGGTHLIDLMESGSREALGMGISYVLVDGQNVEGDGEAFAAILTAEDVINWSAERTGDLDWVTIRQVVHEQDDAESPRRYFLRVTMYDRESMRRWQIETNKAGDPVKEDAELAEMELENPIHNLGYVPVFPIYGRRVGPMMGESFIKGSARADLAVFNQDSWLQMSLYRHANPLLKAIGIKAKDLTSIFTGGNAMPLDRGQDIAYAEAPTGSFEAREKAIDRYTRRGIGQTGMNPRATADGPNTTHGQSGIAMRVEFTQTQKKHIDSHAKWITRATRSALDAAEAFLTAGDEPTPKTVRLKSTFEVTETADLMGYRKDIEFMVPSPTLVRELDKRLARKILGSDAAPEKIAAIEAEIEQAEYETEPAVEIGT